MNERIRELAEQANDFADNNYRNTPNIINGEEWSPCKRDNWRELMQEKFAELIVKECADFLKDNLDDHFAAEQLEEHFGVQ